MLLILAVVGSTMAVTVLATLLAGRSRGHEQADDRDADSRGFLGAVVSGLFIVALAFYTVIVWEAASAAEDNASKEAAAIVDVYWQTGVVPQPQRDHIRAQLQDYTRSVVQREWPRMAVGSADDRTGDLLGSVHREIISLPATPDQVKSARERSMERLREITDLRRDRLDQAGGLSTTGRLTLAATMLGAAGMIVFPLLIGFTARVRHVVQMALIAGLLAVVCVMCVGMMHPFSGLWRVEPDSFTSVSEELSQIPLDPAR